ncbi:hypothetical protein CFC21_009935 [Triticum aestivum]|uniref:Uncharacterized protein n=2 Tax=Triticum aestivum TaxID=4565 RepID=A0A3B5ZMU4_WHEAT|nr:putative disease resistance protein RGA3 [Triticum aestivum]XP_044447779.1 putative disease resistance protein RGA3 [Triticum aestivum]XP_044447780.1 putative disease resistance protein RGA3 [Triticum aestivum]XP_044447781.1 putative disease resistance protein RGA3 [Triticum aestivum]XP_044447782.1 putative disease resistance protein RGA3 [Triticum aestivum]XP_044447783.1 putative disease resistance protein RGA3 [Triticum aestivum]XP_044447784.1 putative disease resistance protein RGA3 [Tr
MAAALGAAQLLLGKVLTKLSDERMASYVASSELGLDSQKIKDDIMYTVGLLQQAQGRGTSDIPGLTDLLVKLSQKADEAEKVLNELRYFMIRDQINGTQLVKPDLGACLKTKKGHARHTIGNCLPFIFRPCTSSQQDGTMSDGHDHVDELPFDSVSISIKIKSVLEETHSICVHVSDLLKLIPNHGSSSTTATTVTRIRPTRGSMVAQDTMYGRRDIFEKTIHAITSCGEILSVLPVVGPGGIGKTTLIQHLYNDKRIEEHFDVRIWVCVSIDFAVLKLTREIFRCIIATEEEGRNSAPSETASIEQLQESIAQRLQSKRFLIVLDDVWQLNSEDEWHTLLAPFKKGGAKGNMVLVTTRFPSIAGRVKTVDPVELQGLDTDDFFAFFEECIFGGLDKPMHYRDELTDIARDIVDKLKGSPLAAKTVGRLLRKDLSWEHWTRVLESMEWENKQSDNDTMPALYLSYDYLPFLLQKCFSYLSLFPEDHRFSHSEINRFWIAVGIIDSNHPGNNNCLEELVDRGFLRRVHGLFGEEYYVIHDLLHELSRSVSTQECLNISVLDFKADTVPPSIQHLSITLENKYDGIFLEEISKLKIKIDIANLRTLMIFSAYEERIAGILKDTFEEVDSLHVLFIVVKSLDDLPKGFSKLIHLQYLKLGSPIGIEMALPSTLARFYHLKFLDLKDWHGSSNVPKDISHLVNLQDFIAKKELHSSVLEVGKMKYLRELKQFCVKKESVGFELRELGELTELGGELRICNLENVATKEEASEAKLMSKRNLKKLTLVWGRKQSTIDGDVLDALQPHPDLRELRIANHGGAVGPSWLCVDMLLKQLGVLHLEGLSWDTLPPFGQLPRLTKLILMRISGVHQLALLSNLTSLTHLTLQDCVKLTVDGFNPLTTVNLKVLVVFNCRWDRSCPESVAADLLTKVASSRVMPAGSFRLEQLKVDSISAVLVTPICNLVAHTLQTLIFCHDHRIKSFTEEQEKALLLLTSLRHLTFDGCGALQSLPRGLNRLSSLKDLEVLWCPEMGSIPKEGFPVSLEILRIRPCSPEVREQIEKLRRTSPGLSVRYE